MATKVKERINVGTLPGPQQKLMYAGKALQTAGQPVTVNNLCVEMEGKATPEVRNRVNGIITNIKKRIGGWPWTAGGEPIPAGELPFILTWDGGGGGGSRSAEGRTGQGTVAKRSGTGGEAQAIQEFVHGLDSLYGELPFEVRTRVKEQYRALEDAVMQGF